MCLKQMGNGAVDLEVNEVQARFPVTTSTIGGNELVSTPYSVLHLLSTEQKKCRLYTSLDNDTDSCRGKYASNDLHGILLLCFS